MDEVTLARFLSKVRISDTGCWEWTGTITEDGYGAFSIRGVNRLAHRLSWMHFVGPIPDDRPHLDHLCHTNDESCPGGKDDPHRRCVCWVGHLEPVTPEENARRARRTHCKQGHEFTPENIYIQANGGRTCKICRETYMREYAHARHPGVLHGTETHCPQGHPYAGDNLVIMSNGGRACRICKNASGRRQMRAKRALERGYLPLLAGSPTCPAGHDLSDGNSAVYAGQLVCLVCMTPDGSRSKKGADALIAAANSALSLSGVLF